MLFSAPMVRALIARRKRVTRRLNTPRYKPPAKGDIVWVRETWRAHERESDGVDGVIYAADGAFLRIANTRQAADQWVVAYNNGKHGNNWRPAIFMPRWAARIVGVCASSRLEHLHDIDDAESVLEGFDDRSDFVQTWDDLNGERSGLFYSANPEVWRIEFKEVTCRTN